MGKIFGIGLSKTGTTSLAEALKILGYKTNDFPSLSYIPHHLLGIKKKQLKYYDAFTDVPVIPFYKKLDKQFPGSKFILTIRDKDSWLNSCKNYPRFNKPVWNLPFKIIKLRSVVFGTWKYDRKKFSDAYDKHLEDVRKYFKDREEDLLELDITRGDDWQKLCEFLNVPIPTEEFPFRNSRKNNYDGHFE